MKNIFVSLERLSEICYTKLSGLCPDSSYDSYIYDAWENLVKENHTRGNYDVHSVNPYRYRGYYWDSETGFFYLQSRYYDPVIGRFINSDCYVNANGDLIGYNMYAYCANNPVMNVDPTREGLGDWLKRKCQAIWNYYSDTYGVVMYVSRAYEIMTVYTVFSGYETGASGSTVIKGDPDKPIVFYFQTAETWWKLWEYKVGVNVNIGNGGFNIGVGVGEITASISGGKNSFEIVTGTTKLGYTLSKDVDFKNKSAGGYVHEYVRPWSIGLAAVLIYIPGGSAAPILAPTGA